MSKLNEVLMRELESLCATGVVLRGAEAWGYDRCDVWVGACSPHVARVLEDGV